MYTDMGRCTQTWSDVHRHGQMHTDMVRCTQTWSDVHRHGQMHTDMVRCTQTWSDAHRHGQMYTDMVRCTQTCSDVSRGNGVLHVLLQLLRLQVLHDEVGLLPLLRDVRPVELVLQAEALQPDAWELNVLEEEDAAPFLAALFAEQLVPNLDLTCKRTSISTYIFYRRLGSGCVCCHNTLTIDTSKRLIKGYIKVLLCPAWLCEDYGLP